jgi:hypothetical protein
MGGDLVSFVAIPGDFIDLFERAVAGTHPLRACAGRFTKMQDESARLDLPAD